MTTNQKTPAPTPKRRRLSREDRKKELLDSAVKIAADIGLGKLVHAEIARANNVVVATVFLYFPDAASLVRAVVEEVGIFYREQCDQRSEEHTSELQSLMRISYAVFCLKKKKKIQLHKH